MVGVGWGVGWVAAKVVRETSFGYPVTCKQTTDRLHFTPCRGQTNLTLHNKTWEEFLDPVMQCQNGSCVEVYTRMLRALRIMLFGACCVTV